MRFLRLEMGRAKKCIKLCGFSEIKNHGKNSFSSQKPLELLHKKQTEYILH